ncbi:hypothetical protein ISR94_02915 [Candidatus Microgenomates bacterium]|nr:hypothetical protein [Candidatus Microgenomates bacterium]
MKKKTKTISATLLFLVSLLIFSKPAFAQDAISLSISPPIFEIMIMPGKEYKTEFNISNQSGSTILTPKIVVFTPKDEFGNVTLTSIPAPQWVKYNPNSFSLDSGNSKSFSVLFSPPKDTAEIDYYLSLVFETDSPTDLLVDNSSLYTAKIASNILLSVNLDGNPIKSAEIVQFNAPIIADSFFGKLNYSIVLKNTGNSFWKPIGKILLGENGALNLAPQNVISGYTRNITCINNENLIPCTLDKKPFLGKVDAVLEFSIDEDPQIYNQKTTTFVFPFSLTIVLVLSFFVLLLTRRRRRRHS